MTTGQILTNHDGQTRELPGLGGQRGAQALGSQQAMESLPRINPVRRLSGGDATGPDGGQFYTRHLLLPYMTGVQNSAIQRQNVVPFNAIRGGPVASNALPNYSFITPDGCNDAHDRGLGCGGQLIKSPRSKTTDCSSLLLGRFPSLARNRKNAISG
jgi:hypothetical protein